MPETCEIIAAVSNISFDKADEIYHKEAADKSFDTIADESKNVWNSLLGKIRISGGSEDKKTVYYTSLYRSFGKMTDMSEYGEYYSGYDNKTHSGNGFYAGDQLWDSFRSMHPLQLLLIQILVSQEVFQGKALLLRAFEAQCLAGGPAVF